MAGGAAALAGVLGVYGGMFSIAGEVLAAKSEGEALRQGMRAERIEQRQRDRYLLESGERTRSANVVAVAKSGVELSGSPIEVLAANAKQVERQRIRERFASDSRIALMKYQKDLVNRQRNLGIASQILGLGSGGLQSFGTSMSLGNIADNTERLVGTSISNFGDAIV